MGSSRAMAERMGSDSHMTVAEANPPGGDDSEHVWHVLLFIIIIITNNPLKNSLILILSRFKNSFRFIFTTPSV